MTLFSDYAARYHGVRFVRGGDGILEMTLHTRGRAPLRDTSFKARRLNAVAGVLASEALMPRARELARGLTHESLATLLPRQ